MLRNLIAANPFGTVQPPAAYSKYAGGGGIAGVPQLVSIVLKTLILMVSIYAVINFVLAGFWYISAGGDSKRVQMATEKIYQSVIGLVAAAGAFVIAGVIGQLIFGNPNAILQITVFGP